MAQTIALQRGTTTVTSNGTTSATLFTQSGGTATRVIPNAIGIYFSATPNFNYVIFGVYVAISGGQTLLVGYLHQGNTTYNRSFQFPISAMPNTGASNGVWNTNGLVVIPTTPYFANTSTTGVGNTAIENVNVNYPLAANTRLVILPSSFYIGASDAIVVKAYGFNAIGKGSPTALTANITYSFTTITET
jgi:hypothetical protein